MSSKSHTSKVAQASTQAPAPAHTPPPYHDPSVRPKTRGPKKKFKVESYEWLISAYTFKDVIRIAELEPNPENVTNSGINTEYLQHILESPDCDDPEDLLKDIGRRQSFANIVGIAKFQTPEAVDWYVVVYDRNAGSYRFASRPLTVDNLLAPGTDTLFVGNPDEAIATTGTYKSYQQMANRQICDRILIVVHNGFLVYFEGKTNCQILIEGQYLIFRESRDKVFWRRVFDTKRGHAIELFRKENELRADSNDPKNLEGMTIFHGIVQRDTPANGSYVVIGEGNAILDMTQVQKLINGGNVSPSGAVAAPPPPATTTLSFAQIAAAGAERAKVAQKGAGANRGRAKPTGLKKASIFGPKK